jgi:hypothetical protein
VDIWEVKLKMFGEGNHQLFILCVIVSLLVYGILWWKEDQKSKVYQGYVMWTVLVGFISFGAQVIFFSDFELSVWGRLTVALTISLMSTVSPLYQMIARKVPGETDDPK